MRILALEASTDWLSVAAGDGAFWHVVRERAGQAASRKSAERTGAKTAA